MTRLFSGFFLFLAVCSACAQATGAEAPADKASPLTVVIFLVLFIGSCAAYFVYLWWNERKKRKARDTR